MKKLSIFLSVIMMAAVSACTLYMDEPEEEGRILRTGEGYDKPETLEMANGQGSVTYKYDQKTIPINDEVEQYIVKVESDTILYFEGGTPEEYLPEVGEMMTCSFRDRFPNAFCHKCIDRTESNGIYRCVFTKCEYEDAFEVLDLKGVSMEMVPSEGGRYLTEEEEDSIFGAEARQVENTRGFGPRRIGLKKNVKKITLPIEMQLTVSAVPSMDIGAAKVALGGELILGGWVEGDVSLTGKSADFDVGIIGGIGLVLDLQARAGITYKLPVGLSPLGIRFDCVVVGGQLGFVADPYLSVHRELYGHAEMAFGIDCGFHYKRDPKDKAHPYGEIEVTHSGTSKMAGKSPFFYVNDSKSHEGFDLNIEAGMDYSIGVGFKIGEGAAEGKVAVGLREYGLMQQKIGVDEYQSVEDFKKRNADFPTYALGYISLDAGVFWVGVRPEILVGPLAETKFKIPIFPVSDDHGYVRCADMQSKLISAEANLDERGILGYWREQDPKLRIYDKETKELVGTLKLTWIHEKGDGGTAKKMRGSGKMPDIEFNHEYIGQFNLDMSAIINKALFPLEEVPFHVALPVVELDKVNVMKTQTADHTSMEEMGNPKIVRKNGQYWAFVHNNHAYNYRYQIDVTVTVKGASKIGRWGIQMQNDRGVVRDFFVNDKSGKLKATYRVRMNFYSSRTEENLSFDTYAVGLNENGKMTNDREYYESEDITVTFNQALNWPFSITDQYYLTDFELKSRKMDNSSIPAFFDSKPFDSDLVLGEVEVIPLD